MTRYGLRGIAEDLLDLFNVRFGLKLPAPGRGREGQESALPRGAPIQTADSARLLSKAQRIAKIAGARFLIGSNAREKLNVELHAA
jgi:hypothetical protein